jgi:hypothetical protein
MLTATAGALVLQNYLQPQLSTVTSPTVVVVQPRQFAQPIFREEPIPPRELSDQPKAARTWVQFQPTPNNTANMVISMVDDYNRVLPEEFVLSDTDGDNLIDKALYLNTGQQEPFACTWGRGDAIRQELVKCNCLADLSTPAFFDKEPWVLRHVGNKIALDRQPKQFFLQMLETFDALLARERAVQLNKGQLKVEVKPNNEAILRVHELLKQRNEFVPFLGHFHQPPVMPGPTLLQKPGDQPQDN